MFPRTFPVSCVFKFKIYIRKKKEAFKILGKNRLQIEDINKNSFSK